MSTTMTPLDAEQIIVGTARGPGLWIAPYPTEPPQAITEDFEDPWVSLGYASEDGPTIANSITTDNLSAWQSLSPIRTIKTGQTLTVQVQLLQWNALNLGLYWDVEAPTIDASGQFFFEVRSDQATKRHTIGVDVRDGDNRIRYIFPRAELSAVGDMNFQRSALAMLDVTFSALEDDGVLLGVMGEVPAAAVGPVTRATGAHSWWPIRHEPDQGYIAAHRGGAAARKAQGAGAPASAATSSSATTTEAS